MRSSAICNQLWVFNLESACRLGGAGALGPCIVKNRREVGSNPTKIKFHETDFCYFLSMVSSTASPGDTPRHPLCHERLARIKSDYGTVRKKIFFVESQKILGSR